MKIFKNFFSSFILFIRYSKILIKARFQFKLDAFLLSFTVLCRESAGIIVVYLTLKKFHAIAGWNMNEMLFLFSILFLTYGLLVLFFTGFRDFDTLVYSGTFDRFLLRPHGLIFQVLASSADYFACIGHGTLGILLFIVTAGNVGIKWNLINISYYLITIIGGVIIQAAIFLAFSSFSFWTVRTRSIRNFVFSNTRKLAGYPLSIFPKFIQKLLIYIIPFAFVNYFPVQFFLRKPDMASFWEGFLYLTLPVGIILYLVVYAFWKLGLKNYSSTGN